MRRSLAGLALALLVASLPPVSARADSGAEAGAVRATWAAALRHDPTLRAAQAQLDAARHGLRFAQAGAMPVVSASLGDSLVEGTRRGTTALGEPASQPLDYEAPTASINLRLPLYNADVRRRIGVAEAELALAEAQFAVRRDELLERVATAWLRHGQAVQSIALAREQVDAASLLVASAVRRLQAGEGTRTEQIDAETELELARARQDQARDQLEQARLELRQLTGLPDPPGAEPADGAWLRPESADWTIPLGATLDTSLVAASERSGALAVRRLAVEVARANVARNAAGHHPRLDLVAGASASRNESVSTLGQSINQRVIGVQLNIPLYAGGGVDAAVARAAAEQHQTKMELAAEELVVARDVTRFHGAVASGAARVRALRKAVANAAWAQEGARRTATAGFGAEAEVARARIRRATAFQDLTQAYLDIVAARMRLDVLTGLAPERILERVEQALAH